MTPNFNSTLASSSGNLAAAPITSARSSPWVLFRQPSGLAAAAHCVPATVGPAIVFYPDPKLTQGPKPQRDVTLHYKKGGQQRPPWHVGPGLPARHVSDQLLSATRISSSIFLASPKSMRLLSL